MIERKPYLDEIRKLGFKYKRQQKRTALYRRPNGTDYLVMPRTGPLTDVFVRTSLLQAGMSQWEVDAFIESQNEKSENR